MRAVGQFTEWIIDLKLTGRITRLRCDFYGSLAATGKAHGTDHAVILGFAGADPESNDVDDCPRRIEEIKATGRLPLPWGGTIGFNARHDLDFKRLKPLPFHSNGMHFTTRADSGRLC